MRDHNGTSRRRNVRPSKSTGGLGRYLGSSPEPCALWCVRDPDGGRTISERGVSSRKRWRCNEIRKTSSNSAELDLSTCQLPAQGGWRSRPSVKILAMSPWERRMITPGGLQWLSRLQVSRMCQVWESPGWLEDREARACLKQST